MSWRETLLIRGGSCRGLVFVSVCIPLLVTLGHGLSYSRFFPQQGLGAAPWAVLGLRGCCPLPAARSPLPEGHHNLENLKRKNPVRNVKMSFDTCLTSVHFCVVHKFS